MVKYKQGGKWNVTLWKQVMHECKVTADLHQRVTSTTSSKQINAIVPFGKGGLKPHSFLLKLDMKIKLLKIRFNKGGHLRSRVIQIGYGIRNGINRSIVIRMLMISAY